MLTINSKILLNNYPILKNRPYQINVILNILENFDKKKYFLLDAPTGSGKTVIALVLSDIFWKLEDLKTHIAVRTSEQIKRYLEDSYEKLKIKIRCLPNKRKSCPVFYKTKLSGEEIICKDCKLRSNLLEYKEIMKRLKKINYDFERFVSKYKDFCLYNSFKSIESNITVTTYPYVFNLILRKIAFKENPEVLIIDESHNLLGSAVVNFRLSIKSLLNLSILEIVEKEVEILNKITGSNIKGEKIKEFLRNVYAYLKNILRKYGTIEDKDIVIPLKGLKEIFDSYFDLLDQISQVFEILKEKILNNEIEDKEIIRKRWRIKSYIKLYNLISNPAIEDKIAIVFKNYNLEISWIDYKEIINNYLSDYNKIILMSGTNFKTSDFSKLFKVNKEETSYIKVDIKLGKKKYRIIRNFTSKYRLRKLEENIRNLLNDIEYIVNSYPKFQLYMFPSFSFMKFIYNSLPETIKSRVFLDTENVTLKDFLKSVKEIIFTYSRSRFVEGIELVENNRSLLKTIVVVGIPYPPPPSASELTKLILHKNNISYKDFAEIVKDIQIKQVIGRAIRNPEDEAFIFFIDYRYNDNLVKKYL